MRFIVIIFILISFSSPALAQDTLPPCTSTEAITAMRILDDVSFTDKLIALKSSSSVEDLLDDFMLLRNTYLFEVEPDLPECYEVQMFNWAAGIYIYNMSLEASLLRVNDSDLLVGNQDRIAIIEEYMTEAQSWVDDILAISGISDNSSNNNATIDIVPTTPPTDVPNRREPANCDEARAMGLTAAQAGQYSHLDRDGDGTACYGD